MTSGILQRTATFFVALAIIFLLRDVFLNLQEELIWIGIAVILVIPVLWHVAVSLGSSFLEKFAKTIAVQKRNLEEFLKACWKRLLAFGAYQIIMWIVDNPLWIAVQLKWHEEGLWAMMIFALLSNAGMLFYHRRKKVSWLGFDTMADFLKEKVEEITEMFFLLTSPRVLIVLFTSTLFSLEPSRCLQALLVFFIIFESVILFGRMVETKWGDVVAFFLLSFWQDSFVVTAYLRHGKCANGLGWKDWTIFFLSLFVSVAYWALRNGLIAELILRPILKV